LEDGFNSVSREVSHSETVEYARKIWNIESGNARAPRVMSKRIFISADHGMAIAGLKSHAQYMEALRADP